MERLKQAAAKAAELATGRSAEERAYDERVAAQLAEIRAGYTAADWELHAAYERILYGI